MANYSKLKTDIKSVIKENGNQEITGQVLQDALVSIISSVGKYAQYVGIATPSTAPGTPDQNVFYLATAAGTYTNFGGIVIKPGEAAILSWNGTWSKSNSGFATQEKLDESSKELQTQITDIIDKYGVYNVDAQQTHLPGVFLTPTQARNAVPEPIRKPGLIITYQTAKDTTVTEQFVGTDKGKWAVDNLWASVAGGGGSLILPWKNNASDTRNQVKENVRKAGLKISYKNGDDIWVNEQFVGTDLSNVGWGDNKNWIPEVSFVQVNDVRNEFANIQLSVDMSKDYATWEDGILRKDGSITNKGEGISKYSDYFAIVPGQFVKYRTGGSFKDEPTILGYDKNKNVKQVITNGSTQYGGNNIEYVKIPKDIYYVRLGSRTEPLFILMSNEEYYNQMVLSKYVKSENYYAPYKFVPLSNGDFERPREYKGTGLVEVKKGDTFITNARGAGTILGMGVYDKEKKLLKNIEKFYNRDTKYSAIQTYTIEDENIAYIACGFYVNNNPLKSGQSSPFLYKLNDNIGGVKINEKISRTNYLYKHTKAEYSPYQDVTKITTLDNGFVRIENTTDFGMAKIKLFESIQIEQLQYTFIGVKIRLESANGKEDAPISLHKSKDYVQRVRVGETIIMPVGLSENGDVTNVIYSDYLMWQAKTTWVIEDVFMVAVTADIYKYLTSKPMYGDYVDMPITKQIAEMYTSKERYNISNYTYNCYSADTLKNTNPFFNGKTYTCFGTSITAGTNGGYAKYIADHFGMKVNNLGVGGSVPHGVNGSLNQTQLEKITSDTMLITIAYTANGWIHSDDINSRDIENSIGAFNHAIDYIHEHNPMAVIILAPDYPAEVANADIRAIAENRFVGYVDLSRLIDNATDKSQKIIRFDGVHLSLYGNYRFAAGFVEEIEKYILK